MQGGFIAGCVVVGQAVGLLRQYFLKGSDFAGITAAQVAGVQERLNDRPRARLGGKAPNEVFFGRRADLLAV